MRWLLPVLLPALLEALDLSGAAVVTPARLSRQEEKAVDLLVGEVASRTGIRWPVASAWPAGAAPAIVLENAGRGPAEGYQVRVEGNVVRVSGNDARGLLFGIGRLLRELRMDRRRIEVPDRLSVTTAPRYPLRGHQLGYRPKTNSYDGWTLAMWEQYIRDLAVFGANAVELIPPRSDDDADSPHFPLPPMETMIGMSKILDDYGLDVWIWYPAMDPDYSKPATVEFALKEWAEVFRRLPRIDAVFVPGGDPGHTQPKYLMALLEKQAASLRRFHPKAQMWVAPQGFNQAWLEEFHALLRQEPAWLNGIVFGPQTRISLAQLRADVPKRYPIRHYPDITHTLRCQYPVPNWDLAYALTLHREPINPRPVDQAAIFRLLEPLTIGFITYSEGCNDDVNKVVWSVLGWDPDAGLVDVLRQYGRYFIADRLADGFAHGLLALERNWRGPLRTNEAVYEALAQFQAMEREAGPQVLLNWRFQQTLYRAYYDACNRSRLIYETGLEEAALAMLREAASVGSLAAIEEAEAILEKAVTQPVNSAWRARVFELAEALFRSIRMQLSVPRYKAIAVGRGANLDLIDMPFNNRLWLKRRFDDLRKLPEESARLAEIRQILAWDDPGPGGFYDDLGNETRQPHLVPGAAYAKDPAHLESPLVGFAGWSGVTTSAWRTSWQQHIEALNDAPVRMRYEGLDPRARYRIRVVYAGENTPHQIRLVADEDLEVHGWRKKDVPVQPVEFEIPAKATSDGVLTLTWTREPGLGGNGRGLQIAEVWLLRAGP